MLSGDGWTGDSRVEASKERPNKVDYMQWFLIGSSSFLYLVWFPGTFLVGFIEVTTDEPTVCNFQLRLLDCCFSSKESCSRNY